MNRDGIQRRHWLAGAALAGVATASRPQVLAADSRLLQIVGPWEIDSLEPARSGYLFTRMQVAETLTDADDAGRALPGLAASWRVSADGLDWRFALRTTARFHDGTAVTAQAAVAALKQASKNTAGVLGVVDLRSIEAEGSATVRIRLGRPFAPLPAVLAHSSLQVLAPSAYGQGGAVKAIVGSGPYRIVRIEAPQQFEVQAFSGYDGPVPAVQRARYLSAGRPEARALMAEGGQSDLAYGLDPASLQRLRLRAGQQGRPTVLAVTLPRTIMIKLNASLPAFADASLRLALSMTIDRAGIARALLREPEMAASQLLPPVLAAWHQAALPALRHDPAAAQAAWAVAGWQRGADGLLQRQGQPLRIKLRTYPDRPELPIVATALQAQWRQQGIACEVLIGNASDIPAGHRDGTLQAALVARNYGITPDPVATLLQDFSAQGGDFGAMRWQRAELTAALDELARGATPERASALRLRVAEILQAELPVVPIAWFRQNVAVSTRVTGVSLDPLERSYRLGAMRWT